MKRRHISRGKSRRGFTRHAVTTNKRNFANAPMRGGDSAMKYRRSQSHGLFSARHGLKHGYRRRSGGRRGRR